MVTKLLHGDVMAGELLTQGQTGATLYNTVSFSKILVNLGLPESLTSQLDSYINSIFDLIWSCGVQTILFLAGLQSIAASFYEVAKVEGATAWETFWFVTMPMMINVLLLNVIYTTIELFTAESNAVMAQAYSYILQADYNNSSAIIWSYCGVFAVIILILSFLISRFVRRYAS